MPDIARERAHLAQAEIDIREGEARISRQEELVAELRTHKLNTTEAEALLQVFRETMLAWKAHRDQIRRTIEKMTG